MAPEAILEGSRPAIKSRWTEKLKARQDPSSEDLRDHLLAVHRLNAGFTESCALRCRNADGQNSYEWLLDTVDAKRDKTVLDLACGSGPLLSLAADRLRPDVALIGVDMSGDELHLARAKVTPGRVRFHQAIAQDLSVVPDGSVDAVLCHWALTLMAPVEPVFAEIRRVLRPGGRFAAIVDGPADIAPGYAAIDRIIGDRVRQEFPLFGSADLGDPRIRRTETLMALAAERLGGEAEVTPSVLTLEGRPRALAEEAAGFFYAAFLLSNHAYAAMLEEVTDHLAATAGPDSHACFSMPVNRLVVTAAER